MHSARVEFENLIRHADGFLSTYLRKEEGAEAKEVKKESSAGGAPPGRVCGPRGQEEQAVHSARCRGWLGPFGT